MFKYLHRRRKAIVALIGSLVAWAVTAFPDNHQVQLTAGLITAVLTGGIVHAVPNAEEGD